MEEKKLTGYPSIDKPWLKYYSEEAIHSPLPDGSMYDYMTACNAGRLLVVSGRLKRIFWAIGTNKISYRVYPMAIEKVISSHAAVKQCAVVGKPDGERGYLVVAYVVPHSNNEWQQVQEELAALCRKELPETSWPYIYHPMDKLPTTPAGKVCL